MTEDEIRQYRRNRECSERVWQGGSELLIEEWNEFVAEVENGYCPDCLIDEYWNDLDSRELIHDIGCDDRVKEADARFAAMLIATSIKHHRKERQSDYDFWNFGYPKNATGFFYEEVKRHILGQ